MSRKIEVQIVGDSKSLEAALGRAQDRASKFGSGLQRAARIGTVALGTLGIGAIAAVKQASDLNEEISKTNRVFGQSAGAIQKWSQTTAESIGISREEALNASSTFGNMLVPMGFARGEAAKLSRNMVNLAGDMASFNNASPQETLDALRSGLAGETEPLRRYGVFLNQARIQQELANEGIHKSWQEVTSAQKAQATYNIIMKDTADTQGDFSRTSNGLANQQRILRAEVINLAAQIGTVLLPYMVQAAGVATQLIGLASEHSTITRVLAGTVVALAGAVVVLNTAYRVYLTTTAALTLATRILSVTLLGLPVVAIAVAILALGAALVVAYHKSETFRNIVNAGFHAVQAVASAVAAFISGPMASAFNKLRSVAGAVIGFIQSRWKALVVVIGGPFGAAIGLVLSHLHTLRNVAGSVLGFFRAQWNTVTSAVQSLWSKIQSVISAVQSLISLINRIPSIPSVGGITGGGASVIHHPVAPHPSANVVGTTRPQVVQVVLDGRVLAQAMVKQNKDYARQNGRGLFAT